MATITVWAESGDIHGNVCSDARLRDEDGSIATADTPRGQAGWQVGIRYDSDFNGLVRKLTTEVVPKHGKIKRLAIHAHGVAGEVYVNGENKTPLSVPTIDQFQALLAQLQHCLTVDAVVIFAGCMAGQGDRGDQLLMEVSRRLPGRQVVAFETIGYAPGGKAQTRKGEGCTEPGMRDTNAISPSGKGGTVQEQREAEWGQVWNNLGAFPWASEFSTHAVVARNGHIIRQREARNEEQRKAAIARIPKKPAHPLPKGQAPLPLMVELTDTEQMVFAVMDGSPKSVDALVAETGLAMVQVEQAVRKLSAKMLIRWARSGEAAGYVNFLNRYVA
jgi:hypothetical protein